MVLGVVGLALLAVVAVVAVVAVTIVTMGQLSSTAGPPRTVVQNATECTDGVSNGEVPTGEMVSAGGLFFPRDVAPGWDLLAEPDEPNSVDAVTLQEEVAYDESEGIGWLANVTVGNTNFDPSLSLSDQAQLMLTCIVSKSYAGASPTLRATNAISSRLDGLPTATVEAAISAVAFDPAITGDDVVLTIVGTTPTSYFLGTSPIGDASRRTVVQAARRELHVSQV
ncbi:hypothetical protein [Mycolicibacterium sp.]|uniref:hypothetical protein n=1 Tax=Mycolicibacterium sp. TaxID=2320850 RepID=UPI001A2A3BC9|nr:hypothetical protein [Mycolicibacterium sp.]MBJ7339212.1 hypothetical protein [Mycolicibacterium sp.]